MPTSPASPSRHQLDGRSGHTLLPAQQRQFNGGRDGGQQQGRGQGQTHCRAQASRCQGRDGHCCWSGGGGGCLAEESGLGCEGACACSESIACNAKSGPKAQRRRVLACGVCPGVIGCGLCSVGSKRGSPCECGPRGALVLVRGAASSGGARGTVGDTGNRSHRAAGRILAPSSPASLPPHHNPQPTTRHTPTHFDAAVGGLGQAVRQQQRHGHGRGCC